LELKSRVVDTVNDVLAHSTDTTLDEHRNKRLPGESRPNPSKGGREVAEPVAVDASQAIGCNISG
jgi:hypothetical protein